MRFLGGAMSGFIIPNAKIGGHFTLSFWVKMNKDESEYDKLFEIIKIGFLTGGSESHTLLFAELNKKF